MAKPTYPGTRAGVTAIQHRRTAPYRSPAGLEAVTAAYRTTFDLLLGRGTYDLSAGIATHRPDSLGWGPVGDLGSDIMEGVRRVKSKDGPDLIVSGSSTLTSVLLDRGLADEVVLIVYPVLLGRGTRLLSESVDPRELALVSTKAMCTGVLMNTYRHVGSLRTESFASSPIVVTA